jgi:hypothetical protein
VKKKFTLSLFAVGMLIMFSYTDTKTADETKSANTNLRHPYPATVHAITVYQQAYNNRVNLSPTYLASLNLYDRLILKMELLRDLKGAERDLKSQLRKEGFSKAEIILQLDQPRLLHRQKRLERELQRHIPHFGSDILGFINNPLARHRAVSEGHADRISQELKTIDLKLNQMKVRHENKTLHQTN